MESYKCIQEYYIGARTLLGCEIAESCVSRSVCVSWAPEKDDDRPRLWMFLSEKPRVTPRLLSLAASLLYTGRERERERERERDRDVRKINNYQICQTSSLPGPTTDTVTVVPVSCCLSKLVITLHPGIINIRTPLLLTRAGPHGFALTIKIWLHGCMVW